MLRSAYIYPGGTLKAILFRDSDGGTTDICRGGDFYMIHEESGPKLRRGVDLICTDLRAVSLRKRYEDPVLGRVAGPCMPRASSLPLSRFPSRNA